MYRRPSMMVITGLYASFLFTPFTPSVNKLWRASCSIAPTWQPWSRSSTPPRKTSWSTCSASSAKWVYFIYLFLFGFCALSMSRVLTSVLSRCVLPPFGGSALRQQSTSAFCHQRGAEESAGDQNWPRVCDGGVHQQYQRLFLWRYCQVRKEQDTHSPEQIEWKWI